MRAPVDTIVAPLFPPRLPWVNVGGRAGGGRPSIIQQGRPMLVEFWDFCRPNSIRTLPYVKAWHERYAASGLRVVGVHASGFPPSEDPDAVRAAIERLGIPYPVVIDVEYEIWQLYGNLGWPTRYLIGSYPNSARCPGPLPGVTPCATGTVMPQMLSSASRSRRGMFACSSSERPVSLGRPPSPSMTTRRILVSLGTDSSRSSSRSTTRF